LQNTSPQLENSSDKMNSRIEELRECYQFVHNNYPRDRASISRKLYDKLDQKLSESKRLLEELSGELGDPLAKTMILIYRDYVVFRQKELEARGGQ